MTEDKMIREKLGDNLSRLWYDRRIEVINKTRDVLTFTQGLPLPDVDHYTYFDPYYRTFSDPQDIMILGTNDNSKFTLKTLLHSHYRDRIAGFCTPEGGNGSSLDGYPVFSIDEAAGMKNVIFLIGDLKGTDRLSSYMYLVKYGINQAKIFITGEFLKAICGGQYLDLPLPKENEVFVDCGCLDMTTSREFYEWCSGDLERIIAFEPDPVSARRCLDNAKKWGLKMTEVIEAAAYNKEGEISFMSTHVGNAKLLDTGNISVQTRTIDDVLKGDRVTFIKMDIEGSEANAIKGAGNTIRKWRPTLAISLYHKPEDVLIIPPLILSLYEGYTLYIRHYSNSMAETVLYAIPEDRQISSSIDKPW